MGKIYRVTVETVDENGEWTPELQLMAPIEAVQHFAPAAVAATLGTSVMPVVAESGTPPVVDDEDQPVKRKRRTKAEMEAARAAEARVAAGEPVTQQLDESTPVMAMDGPPPENDEPKPAYNPFG